MQKIDNPIPLFLDARGTLLDGGNIYVGTSNADPQASPINVFWDSGLTQPAAQPLQTLGGRIVNGATPSQAFVSQGDYSLRITDAFDVLVDYIPSIFAAGASFQPLDGDLTTISAQTNTSFGLNLLTLANQNALAAATGITAFTGGTVTQNITRSGAGPHMYWASSGFASGRVFLTASGAADPTSQPGDCWLQYA